MDAAKDTPQQEKQKRVIVCTGGGKGGSGGLVVWGGVAMVAALVAVSYSAIKFMKRRLDDKTSTRINETNKGNELAETKNNARRVEIIAKMREDKAGNNNQELAREEERTDENIMTNHTTQNDNSAIRNQVDVVGAKQNEAIEVVQNTPQVEAERREQLKREQDRKHRELVAKRDDDLAEEIEVETPRTLDSENEDSYEDSSVNEDERDNAGKKRMKDAKELFHGKDDSSETSEEEDDDEEEESEERSEETEDSSMESNADEIWPAETMDNMLAESTKRTIDNQILKETTDPFKEVETKEKEDKNNRPTTQLRKMEDAGQSVFSSSDEYIEEFRLFTSNATAWIWGIFVLTLALAAPLLLSPVGILKLALVVFFVVGLYRAVGTII